MKYPLQLLYTGLTLALLSGCMSTEAGKQMDGLRSSARASGSETHQYNMARLEAEIAHASKPLVHFKASPEALQILAASGEPLELIVNNPYLMLSDPVAPWWHRLIPDGRDLLWGGITIWQAERNYSLQKRQIRSTETTNQTLLGKIPDEPIIITLPE